MKKVVFASGNLGKLHELDALVQALDWQLVPQSEFAITPIEETGTTFVENAILKARHAAECSGLPALADDSGLEVDALQGAPGVFSSRYAGVKADDQANIHKLLTALADVPDDQRGANYRSVLVLMRHARDPSPIICQGTWHGHILHALPCNPKRFRPNRPLPDRGNPCMCLNPRASSHGQTACLRRLI